MHIKDTIDGIEITCDSSMSYIGFKADWMEAPDGWFFQGDEADNVINEIEQYATVQSVSDKEAAVWWCNLNLY